MTEKSQKALAEDYDLCGLVYASAAMHNTVALAVNVAQSDAPVLITGPSGSGKELVLPRSFRQTRGVRAKPSYASTSAPSRPNSWKVNSLAQNPVLSPAPHHAVSAISRALTKALFFLMKLTRSHCRDRSNFCVHTKRRIPSPRFEPQLQSGCADHQRDQRQSRRSDQHHAIQARSLLSAQCRRIENTFV